MPITPFPHGISSFGMPVMGPHPTVGNVYFVDSGHAYTSNANPGTDPSFPLATLNGAMDKVTASNGDVVYFAPGHAENVSAATTQIVDVAGVKLIGLGHGTTVPTFTYTATAGSFEVDAANTWVENMRFVAGTSAVVVGINIDAANCTMANCQIDFSAASYDFLTIIDCSGVDDFHFLCNDVVAEASPTDTIGAIPSRALLFNSADHCRVIGNRFYGEWANSAIEGSTDTDGTGASAGGVCADMWIADNAIYTQSTDTGAGNIAIDFNGASTGFIVRNMFGADGDDGVSAFIDPGSMICIENYGADAIDQHGIVTPATAST